MGSTFMWVDWGAGDEVPYLSSTLGLAEILLELLSLTDTFCGKYPTRGRPPFRLNLQACSLEVLRVAASQIPC